MRRQILTALIIAFLGGCAGNATRNAAVPLNHRGLRVVPDLATYQQRVADDPSRALVALQQHIPGIVLDIRYATTSNFMNQALYPQGATAYLRRAAADALREVQTELAAEDIGLKVFDAYRPYSVTEVMWEAIRNPDYVADPARGSRHNRGAAVDLSLIDLKTGAELPMPTPYDDFTPRAAHAFTALPADALANRARLRDVMMKHGFEPLPSEWWHYDFGGWQKFDLMNVPLEALATLR